MSEYRSTVQCEYCCLSKPCLPGLEYPDHAAVSHVCRNGSRSGVDVSDVTGWPIESYQTMIWLDDGHWANELLEPEFRDERRTGLDAAEYAFAAEHGLLDASAQFIRAYRLGFGKG